MHSYLITKEVFSKVSHKFMKLFFVIDKYLLSVTLTMRLLSLLFYCVVFVAFLFNHLLILYKILINFES